MQTTRACWEGGGSLPRLEHASASDLDQLEARIGYRFRAPHLLERALTHSSRAHEEGDLRLGNERLEFLGDAVLDLMVSELLMKRYPDADEGALSQSRARAVNTHAIAERARDLDLPRLVRLGRGERRSGGSDKPSILANVFEALLGALYLDGGLEPVRTLVEREFGEALAAAGGELRDPKTRLQETLQERGEPLPSYRTTADRGPDHAKEFEVEVRAGGQLLGTGAGRSKREAEQAAARDALKNLGASES